MIDCMTLRDRMPDVAHGVARWSDAEAAHIASCEDCGREWRLVLAGAALQKHVIVSADRVAETVLGRLRSEPVPIRRIPWRGSVIGLLAAAASVLVIVYAPRLQRGGTGSGVDTAVVGLLPELQGLDNGQLETVLQSLEPSVTDAGVPGESAHLDDLSDAQLTKLLHAMGGE